RRTLLDLAPLPHLVKRVEAELDGKVHGEAAVDEAQQDLGVVHTSQQFLRLPPRKPTCSMTSVGVAAACLRPSPATTCAGEFGSGGMATMGDRRTGMVLAGAAGRKWSRGAAARS